MCVCVCVSLRLNAREDEDRTVERSINVGSITASGNASASGHLGVQEGAISFTRKVCKLSSSFKRNKINTSS